VPELTFATEEACVGSTYGSVYVFDGTSRGDLELSQALGCFVGSEEIGIGGGSDIDLDGDGEHEYLLLGTGNLAIVSPIPLPTWGEPVLDWGLATGPLHIRSGTVNNIGNVDLPDSGDDILFFIPNDETEEGNSYLYPGRDVPWFDRDYWPNAE
jgi:hypothetical protein